MRRTRLSWLAIGAVMVILVAAAVDAIRSSEPSASSSRRETVEKKSEGEPTVVPATAPESLPRCNAQNIGVSIDVLGGTATVAVRHVWGRACHLASLPVRLSVADRVGRRVRLATLDGREDVQSRVGGDFSPGFEQLIDVPYLAEPQLSNCDRPGPFTAFVTVGPHSAQRKLSGTEVGCFRGG